MATPANPSADEPRPPESESSSSSSKSSLESPLPTRPRRRWRKVVTVALLVVVLTPLTLWWQRAPIIEWVLEDQLPSQLQQLLGAQCQVARIHWREREGAEASLAIEIEQLSLTGATWGNARSDSITVYFKDWASLYQTPDVPSRVVLRGGRVEWADSASETPTSSWIETLQSLSLPAQLPEIPFTVEFSGLDVIDGAAALPQWSVHDAEGMVTPRRCRVAARVNLGEEESNGKQLDVSWTPPQLQCALADWGTANLQCLPIDGGWDVEGDWKLHLPASAANQESIRGTLALHTPRVTPSTDNLSGWSLTTSTQLPLRQLLELLPFEEAQRLPETTDLSLSAQLQDEQCVIVAECITSDGTLALNSTIDSQDFSLEARTVAWSIARAGTFPQGMSQGVAAWSAHVKVPVASLFDSSQLQWSARLSLPEGEWIEHQPLLTPTDATPPGEPQRWNVKNLVAELSGEPGDTLTLESFQVGAFGGEVTASGTIAAIENQNWNVAINARGVPMQPLAPWVPVLRDLAGTVELQASITGPQLTPRWHLSGSVQEGEAAFPGWERLRAINGRFTINPETAQLQDISMKIGGGRATANGTLRFPQSFPQADSGSGSGGTPSTTLPRVDDLALQVEFDRVRLLRSSDLRARGSGRIDCVGTWQQPKLVGDVTLVRGIYDRNFHPRLNPTAGGAAIPFDLFSIEDGFASRMQFDLTLRLAGGFLVRNNRIDVAPVGALRLGGTGAQPILTGSVTATEGKLSLPHLTLQIGQAEIRFPIDDPFRPRIQFQGTGKSAGYEIQATAEGDLHAPEVSFVSTPFLAREDLLLLVATGQTRAAFNNSNKELQAAMELARLYGPAVWERVFGRSRGPSLLDRVEITTEAAASSDDSDRVTVELRLYDWLSIATEKDSRGDINLDLLVHLWFR